jgi:SPP1 family predicted phage head-tail adaptor
MDARFKYNKSERIGKLNTLVILETYTETTNTFGERVESWTTLATVWANVDAKLSATDEVAESGQETVRQRVDFTIRNRSGITERARVNAGNKYYDIESMFESNDNQYLTLQTRRVK